MVNVAVSEAVGNTLESSSLSLGTKCIEAAMSGFFVSGRKQKGEREACPEE